MRPSYDLIVRGGRCVTPSGTLPADVGITAGRISALGSLSGAAAAEELGARGLHVLPGIIDSHVHFREPGFEHKEDLASGSRGALLGGVTAVVEMPNTDPPTTTEAALRDKRERAHGRAFCHVGFYVGATPGNADALGELERSPGCAGIKLFMGRSTGGLLVDAEGDVRRVLRAAARRVAVHAEDEARLVERSPLRGSDPARHPLWRDAESARLATERVLRLARETGCRIHLLHVTTAEELELLARHRDLASVEVTPQHLLLEAPDCYARLGTRAQINPPIREASHARALWRGLLAGTVDTVASDHAPHTLEEKAQPYPDSPSGMPGVQTLVPLMLDAVNRGRIRLERAVELCSAAPARILGIPGKGRLEVGADADLTLVDLAHSRVLEDGWIASRCAWTPFAGRRLRGWPRVTVLGGCVVARDGEVVGPPSGKLLAFANASLTRGDAAT
jgi:dihydroorotase